MAAKKNAKSEGKKTAPKSDKKLKTILNKVDPKKIDFQAIELSNIKEKDAARMTASPIGKAKGTCPHMVIEARAGCGKTTTLIEAVKRLQGIDSAIDPSDEQRAIWSAIQLGKAETKSIVFLAFNKGIVDELARKIPAGTQTMTTHSLGVKSVNKHLGRFTLDQNKTKVIVEGLMQRPIHEINDKFPGMVDCVKNIVSLCKQNLLEGTEDDCNYLISHHMIETEGFPLDEVYDLVPKILEVSKDPKKTMSIDFDDMIWLPIVRNLPVEKFDLVLVDEAQDLNKARQELVFKAGRRIVVCGDPKQAIYGFAGADTASMDNMEARLAETDRGVIRLFLTMTYRCGQTIVEEANKIVPNFFAHENNPYGMIVDGLYPTDPDGNVRPFEKTYLPCVRNGDMILCRVNAPLVSQCFKLLKMGIKAQILGRNIGQGLVSLIKKLDDSSIGDMLNSLMEWREAEMKKEGKKKYPNEDKLIGIEDKTDCISMFIEEVDEKKGNIQAQVIAKIDSIFSDNINVGVRLSSIHKAKGLESERVFFLMPKGANCPHPMARTAWSIEQEYNLKYVAITRAISELWYVR